MLVNARERERPGIDDGAVSAGAGDDDGDFFGNRVQVVPVRHALFIAEIVVVPAAALEPLALARRILLKIGAQIVQKLPETARVSGKLGH